MKEEIRVRIAPSPTGLMHIGLARTALFNYLFSRKNNGKFILRIEDTDTERSKPEYEKNIIEGINWLGLKYDEGPDINGPFGPYRQSEKLKTYRKYLEQLLNENKAYYCFCKEEDLEAQRQYQMSTGQAPRYNGHCGNISLEEANKRIAAGESSVIRFRMPKKKVVFNDIIRGKTEFDADLFGDVVIAKNLDSPLYNFAVVVDDFEMKISHVVRGEEHLSNTPRQILIQEALGFSSPKYAHLSLILAPDRTKLSKRHGATSVEDYRNEGYLPEALINFIAFLGWNPGGEKEIYSLSMLEREFELEKCQKGGAIFNVKKLDSLNGFYIRQKSIDKLTDLCLPFLINSGLIRKVNGEANDDPIKNGNLVLQGKGVAKFIETESNREVTIEKIQKVIGLAQDRLRKLSEIGELVDYFFKRIKPENNLLKWKDETDEEVYFAIQTATEKLSKLTDWSRGEIERNLLEAGESFKEKTGKERGYFLWPIRAGLSGKQASVGPFEIADALGKEETLVRLQTLLDNK